MHLIFQEDSVRRAGRSRALSRCSDGKKDVEGMVILTWGNTAHFQRMTECAKWAWGEKTFRAKEMALTFTYLSKLLLYQFVISHGNRVQAW